MTQFATNQEDFTREEVKRPQKRRMPLGASLPYHSDRDALPPHSLRPTLHRPHNLRASHRRRVRRR